jgi:hypothetical protein
MRTHASRLAIVVFVSAATLPARADVTVFFTSDGAAPALTSVAGAAVQAELATTPESSATVAPLEVRVVRVGDGSGEAATLVLRDASGAPVEGTLDRLSILARPRGVEVPATLASDDPDFVAPQIRRLHPGLLPPLTRLAEHFAGHAIEIVSGYRPNAREGSRHRVGRALDLRLDGVSIDELHAFVDAEPATGVGLYPTSGFVHLDVRSERVRWIDDSGPGEAPHVTRSEVIARDEAPRVEPVVVATPADEPPATPDPDVIAAALSAAESIRLDLALPQ